MLMGAFFPLLQMPDKKIWVATEQTHIVFI